VLEDGELAMFFNGFLDLALDLLDFQSFSFRLVCAQGLPELRLLGCFEFGITSTSTVNVNGGRVVFVDLI